MPLQLDNLKEFREALDVAIAAANHLRAHLCKCEDLPEPQDVLDEANDRFDTARDAMEKASDVIE